MNAILIVFAFVFFVLAAVNVSHPRVNFVGAGLACWIGTLLRALFVGLVLLAPTSAFAQSTAAWTAPSNVASAAAATALQYRLYVNNATPTNPLAGVTCTGTPPTVDCSAPLPAGTPVTIDTRFELTAKSTTSAETPRSVPFISPPAVPTALRVTP